MTILIEAFNETKHVAGWASDERCAVSYGGLVNRLAGGMPPEAAITTPPYGGTRLRTAVEAFGESKLVADWARDPRCAVTMNGLYKRIAKGWTAEEAIATKRGAKQKADREERLERARLAVERGKRVIAWLRLEASVDAAIIGVGWDLKDEELRSRLRGASRQYRLQLAYGGSKGYQLVLQAGIPEAAKPKEA